MTKYNPELPAGYELPDYDAYRSRIEVVHGHTANNLQIGNWLASGRGITHTAGMYPEGYIGYPPIVQMLAEQLKIPGLQKDFNMSADDYSTDPTNSNKFKPIV